MKDYKLSEIKKICEETQKDEVFINPLKCFNCLLQKQKVCELVYGFPRNWVIDEKDGSDDERL